MEHKEYEEFIYDTAHDGYEGLREFPIVIETLELVVNEKKKVKKSSMVEKPKVIFTVSPQLRSIR